jgi:hypothetical protein
MKPLDRSVELLRRSDELRARSMRMHAAVAERMAASRRRLAAAQGYAAVLNARSREPARRWDIATVTDLPEGRDEERGTQAAQPPRSPYRTPGVPGSVQTVDPAPRDPTLDDGRFRPVPLDTEALLRRAQEARARAQATRDQIREGRSRRQVLHDSAYARLVAKQETLPVIEQAKGVIMAQRGCGPEEAFKLLRQASQRTNIKLNALATQIVEHIAGNGKGNGDNVTPLTVGAKRQLRPGTRSRPPPQG